MRIKKKNIREALDMDTDKIENITDDAAETVKTVADGLAGAGVSEPENVKIAGSLVSGVMDNSEEVSENAGLPGTLDKNGNPIPAICMEVVRPSMTKSELIETVLGKKDRKIIKTLKIKDLRNE